MSAPSSPTGTSEWEKFKEQGNTHFKAGNYAQAAESYGEAIKANPAEALLYSNRAAAYLKSREYEAALNDALRAVEIDPFFTKAYSRLHTAYQSLGRFKDGVDRLERVIATIKASPNAAQYADTITELQLNIRESREYMHKLAKARSLLEGGAFAEAEATIRPLFVSFPDSPAVVSCYAECKAPTDPEAANRCLMPLFRTHSNDSQVSYVRALVSYYRGNDGFKNAQILLREALSLDPDHQPCKDLRKKMQRIEAAKDSGNNFFKARDYEAAVKSYSEGIAEDERNVKMIAVLRGNRSAALVELKQYEKALVDVDFALSNGNETAKMHARRSRICENLEKWDEATRDLNRAAELDPQSYQQEARQMKAKAKKGKRKDFYKILNVERGAGEADIKRAYKRQALQWHPDRWANGTEEEKATAEIKFKELGEALAILGDSKKRGLYDSGALDNDTEGAGGMGGMGGFGGMGGMGGGMGMDMNDILAAMMMGGMGGMGGGGGMRGGGGRGSRRGGGPSFFQFHQ